MSEVNLVFKNREGLVRFIKGAVRDGYLRRFDLREVSDWINRAEYPVTVPVDLKSMIEIGGNPVVRGLFGGSIEKTLTKYVSEAMAN